MLFVQREPYSWGLRFELSIAAYWTGAIDESLALSEALLNEAIPDWLVPWVQRNRECALAYVSKGERSRVGVLEVPSPIANIQRDIDLSRQQLVRPLASSVHGVRFIEVEASLDDADSTWSVLNPSIVNGLSELGLILRQSNYVIDRDGKYVTRDGSDRIKTRNCLRILGSNGEICSEHALPEAPDGPPVFDVSVSGVEDIRLVWLNGRWVAFGACRDRNQLAFYEMAVWDLGVDGLGNGPLKILRPDVSRHEATRHEKNWMPFVASGELHAVYSCDPLIVLKVNPTTGSTLTTTKRDPGQASDRATPNRIGTTFRGGSQGCLIAPHHWRFVVHEVISGNESKRIYSHRFVDLVRDEVDIFRLSAISPSFSFTGSRIEFCAGLALDRNDLLISFGVNDAQAFLARVPLVAINEWMYSI